MNTLEEKKAALLWKNITSAEYYASLAWKSATQDYKGTGVWEVDKRAARFFGSLAK